MIVPRRRFRVRNRCVLLTALFGSLAALSLILLFWQVVVALRFPLHRPPPPGAFSPPITILKPLKGCDAKTRECLRSWLTQDYAGRVQVLFGVASADDPVCGVVRELLGEHPERTAELVICGEQLGLNAKVSQLIQLERRAVHDWICVSDADVWVPAHYLASAIAPLREPGVGLVNSFYALTDARGFGMRWEAFAVNADFWSQVLQSISLKPMDFALGAVMVVARSRLLAIGGFSALADYLADDYQLGHRIQANGARLVLCPLVVECRSAPMGFREAWVHQLRWARTIRVCQPGPFFWSVLANASLWPLLWVVAAPSHVAWLGCIVCLGSRMLAGALLERRLIGKWSLGSLGMAVTKDLLQVVIWLLAFTGSQVVWRGVVYQVGTGGRLRKLSDGVPPPKLGASIH